MAIFPNRLFHRAIHCHLNPLMLLLWLICLAGCQKTATIEGIQRSASGNVKVNVFVPKRVDNASMTASYFGKLKANRSRTLGFSTGGSLTSAPEAQQKFSAGATIAVLESAELTQQLSELQNQLTTTSSTDPRYSGLQTQIADLETEIAQRSILAPFDCIVERSFAQENSLVRPNSPIVSVVETTTPKIEISLPRRIVKLIDLSGDYVFVLDGEKIEATVRERSFSEKPPGNIRMVFDIKTNLSEIDFYLDQSVEARFSFPTDQSGHWLPLSCLQQGGDGVWSVLVIKSKDEQHKILRQAIEIAQLRDDSALVTSDLQDRLIVRDGVHRVVPGQQVDLKVVSLDSEVADASAAP